MIKSLYLENFKAFKSPTNIEFAPITLILGPNSAGKTSILQSLSLIKQTRKDSQMGAALIPKSEEWLVDLGSFSEMIYGHDVSHGLTIGIETHNKNFDNTIGFNLTFKQHGQIGDIFVSKIDLISNGFNNVIASYEYKIISKNDPLLRVMRKTEYRTPKRSNVNGVSCKSIIKSHIFWESCYKLAKNKKRKLISMLNKSMVQIDKVTIDDLYLISPMLIAVADIKDKKSQKKYINSYKINIKEAIKFYSKRFSIDDFINRIEKGYKNYKLILDGPFPDVFPSHNVLDLTLPELAFIHEELESDKNSLIDINYLNWRATRSIDNELEKLFPMGPYRSAPKRYNIFSGTTPTDVGYLGQQLPDLLLKNDQLETEVNKMLSHLNIGYSVHAEPVSKENPDLFEILLRDTLNESEIEVMLTDVGYGVSQILPFIVQSLVSRNKIISIEQPEVHIHPQLQANLGNLIEKSFRRFNNQFLIETHSEHLVLRMQKLVRDKTLKPKDISVLFVSKGKAGSEVVRLHLDDNGDFIDDWPGGFFPERINELN